VYCDLVFTGLKSSPIPGHEVYAGEKTICIDATGAGDAFNAGFIHAWLQKLPMVNCLESGHRCGARAVGHLGGIGE